MKLCTKVLKPIQASLDDLRWRKYKKKFKKRKKVEFHHRSNDMLPPKKKLSKVQRGKTVPLLNVISLQREKIWKKTICICRPIQSLMLYNYF
jgi:hypothetical protein